jgi:hypothetical protein
VDVPGEFAIGVCYNFSMKALTTLFLVLVSTVALAKKNAAASGVGSRGYVYEARSAATKKQFWESLPKAVQDEITKTYPRFEYVTACKGSYGGSDHDVVVGVVMAQNQLAAARVFQMDKEKIKSQFVVDISSLPLDGTPNDYIETYCKTGEYALKSGDMATFTRKPTKQEPIILLKTNAMNGLAIFALDEKKSSITSIGFISPP